MESPWFEVAEKELGVHEIPGPRSEKRIQEYIASTTYPDPNPDDSEVPWCSCFVNWCMEQAGIKGTDSAWARSWLNWGREPTDDDGVGKGAVVVLERGANSGHVGFLDDWDYVNGNGRVRLLGGNQGNKVGYAWFPMERVLGYRIPA
jgi:uncharacterized protein (TIGR02594 family)